MQTTINSRNTLPVVPRQSRPKMVVMSFRVPVDVRERFIAKAESMGDNPTEVIRDLVTDWSAPEED